MVAASPRCGLSGIAETVTFDHTKRHYDFTHDDIEPTRINSFAPPSTAPARTVASGPAQRVVFLFDVDNTLLDNDRVTADLKHHLESKVGPERAQRR